MSTELQRMTAQRAVFFLERFKREEKMLGPNEQAALDFALATLSQQAEAQLARAGESALTKYRRLGVEADEKSPIERLRVFCSFAMNGQDWLDVEPFFDELPAQPAPSPQPAVPVVSDEQIDNEIASRAYLVRGSFTMVGYGALREFARAILALRPQAVPMTLEPTNDVGLVPVVIKPFTQAQRRRLWSNSPEIHEDAASMAGFERIVSLTERAHSITAQGRKGEQG